MTKAQAKLAAKVATLSSRELVGMARDFRNGYPDAEAAPAELRILAGAVADELRSRYPRP